MTKLEETLSLQLEYDDHNKEAFHREASRVLRSLAKALGLGKGQFRVKSCKGGDGVGGEVRLEIPGAEVYINSFQVAGCHVLYRTRIGTTIGANRWAPAADLSDLPAFAATLRAIIS